MHIPRFIPILLVALLFPVSETTAEPGDESWSSAYHLPGLDGALNSMTAAPEGLYLCGAFAGVGDHEAKGIALITETGGSLEVQAMGDGLAEAWGKTVVYEGMLTVSGRMIDDTGTSLYGAYCFDGDSWTRLGDPEDHCFDLAVFNGELYRVGFDLNLGYDSSTLWRWTGLDWSPVVVCDGGFWKLLVHDGLLYVAGVFSVVDSVPARNIAQWDGQSISPMRDGIPGAATGLTVWNGHLVAAGNEDRNAGFVRRWEGTIWYSLMDPGRSVDALTVWNGELVAATDSLYSFTGGSIHYPDVRVYDAGDWTSLVEFRTEAMANLGDRLFMGNPDARGMAGEIAAPGVVVYRNGALEAPFPGGLGFEDHGVQLAPVGDDLALAGSFRFGGGQVMELAGAFDGVSWSARDLDLDLPWYQEPRRFHDFVALGDVHFGVLELFEIDISDFLLLRRNPAPPTNGAWERLNSSPGDYGPGSRLQAVGGRLFTWRPSRKSIKEIDPTTGSLSDLAPLDIDGYVKATCAAETVLVVAGDFTTLAGTPSSNILRYEENGWSDFAPALPGAVEAVTVLPDGRLAASYDTGSGRRVATFLGGVWTHLDGEFDGPIHSIVWHQDHMVVAGHFTTIGPYESPGISVWAGNEWATIGSGLSRWGSLYQQVELATTSHGLYAAGEMLSAGGHRTSGLAVWTGDLRLLTGSAPPPDDIPSVGVPFNLRAYPNPFNPRTVISWDLPEEGLLDLAVYDLRGRRVRTLVAGLRPAGPDEAVWDGTLDAGRAAPSGVYHLRLEVDGVSGSRKLTLVR